MSEIQYLDYEGLLRYHGLIDAQKANKSEIADVLRYSELTLTAEQKALARANIGAGTGTVTSTAHTITVKSGKKADGTTDITATSSSATSPSVTLGSSGATAGAYGDTSNQTPSAGATFKVPSISVNAQGIVTAVAEHTVKIPAATQNTDNTGIKLDTVSGTKKTDTTVIKANSSTGLSIEGGTNLFKIGNGTNYIEVPVTPSIDNNVTGNTAWSASDKIVVTNASSGNVIKATNVAVSDLATLDSPAFTGTPTAPTPIAGTNTTQIATTAYVQNAISGITDAMVFIGTIGKATNGSGTVSALPTTGVKVGHTYKIVDENKSIAAANSATGATVTAKIGDTIVATDTTPKWVVIPSGDEPSGTVTSVKILATAPILIDNDSAITSSGTKTVSHDISGVTAGSYGPTANTTASNNTKIKVPQITVDSFGHVTEVVEREITALNTADTNQKVKAGNVTFDNNDVVDFVAGSNVTVTGNASDKTITIAATDTTYDVVSTSANGLAPKLVTGGTNLAAASTDYVLSYISGDTNPVWRKLPANAYNNDTYTGYNIAFLNNAGTTVDTYKALTSPSKNFKAGTNVEMVASSNTITISASMPVISYGTLGSLTLDNTKQIDSLFITT